LKVLVTGADGLLGSNLVRELIDKGHKVAVLIQPGADSNTLDGIDVEKKTGDLIDESMDLAEVLKGFDALIHCAAITDLWADPGLTWKVNLEGTRRLLDACVEAGVNRVVAVGSASSYAPGSIDAPGDETGAFPEVYKGAAYMESKRAAAELAIQYARDKGLDAVVVAPTFMIGPHDSRPSGGEMVKQYIEKGVGVATPGGRNFAYAPNVAKAIVAALDKGKAGESYILGGENMNYLDFFGRLAKISGAPAPKRVVPAPVILAAGRAASLAEKVLGRKLLFNHDLARFSLAKAYYSSAKAERELGLEKTDVDFAIEESIKSLIGHGHLHLKHGEKFKDKVALITGASRGVGFALSRALVLRGAKVVMTARGEERLLDSRDKLKRLGGEVVAIAGDVGDWDDAGKMVSAAVDEFGRLDLVVNNAGATMRGNFHELAPEVCDQVSRTNWDGCMRVSRAAMEHLIESRGSLVFISSIAGIFGLPGASIYCATKKALTGLSESLRIELAPKGVHVGVVHLGFTEHDPEKRIIAADGSLTPPDRPAHITQAEAAEQIVDMVAKRKRKLLMTPVGKLGAMAYKISPGFLERAVILAQRIQTGTFKKFS